MKEKTETTYTLILTEEEASWLHAMCQNPLMCDNPSDEPVDELTIRRSFFDATTPIYER